MTGAKILEEDRKIDASANWASRALFLDLDDDVSKTAPV